MSQSFSKWIRKWEPWITRGALSVYPRQRSVSTLEAPESILIVKTCCLGDAILSLYAIRAFHETHSKCRIEVLVSHRIEAVYRSVDFIHAVHVLPITGFHLGQELFSIRFAKTALKLLRHLRQQRFDWLIDLELYRTFGPLIARILKIGYSRGFAVPGAPKKQHDITVFRGKGDPEWKCFYSVLGLPAPTTNPESIYPNSNPDRFKSVGRIGLVFGSSRNWPQKRWPLEKFIALGRDLQAHGFQLVVYGDTSEIADGQRLAEAIPCAENTTGTLDYAHLIHSLQTCHLVVGNDTGTLHAASAAGVSVVTLFGPTSPSKWNALTSRPVFLESLPCRPCYYLSSMPPCDHRSCLNNLENPLVLSVVLEELKRVQSNHIRAADWTAMTHPSRQQDNVHWESKA